MPNSPVNNLIVQKAGTALTGLLAANGTSPVGAAVVADISNGLDLIGATWGDILFRGTAGWEVLAPGTAGKILSTNGPGANPTWIAGGGGSGDVVGPASAVNLTIAIFDGTTGKLIKDTAATIAADGSATFPIAVSSAGGGGINVSNSNSGSSAKFNAINDTGASGGFGIFGSAFPIPSFQNNAVIFCDNGILFLGDGGVPSGGTHQINFIAGGYGNTPSLTVDPGNPGKTTLWGSVRIAAFGAGAVVTDASGNISIGSFGSGDVVGPASATSTALVRFNGTTGKLIEDSNVTLANSGTAFVFSGASGLTSGGSNQNVVLTPSGTGAVTTTGEFITVVNVAGGAGLSVVNSNSAGSGLGLFRNNAGSGGGFAAYGSTFAIPAWRNDFHVFADNNLAFSSDGNVSSGGTHQTQFYTGGYANNPTMVLTAGSPGRILLGAVTDDGASIMQVKDSSMSNALRFGGMSGSATYGMMSFGASRTFAAGLGIVGGDAGDLITLYFVAPTSGSFQFFVNGTVVGTLNASGWLMPGKITVSANGEGLALAPVTGTSAAYQRYQNTGAACYIGLDNSAGTAFGFGAYTYNIYSANDLVLSRAGVERVRLTSTGLTVGALTTNGGLQTFGAANSGGAGFRLVLVPN